jgi:hypothetical protein
MRNKHKLTTGLAVFALAALLTVNFAFAETTTTTDEEREPEKVKLNEARLKTRAAKAKAIIRLEQNQVSRAQNAIDRLSAILERIEGLEEAEEAESEEEGSEELHDLITLAKKQKADAEKSLADVKTKAKTLSDALAAASADTTLTAPTKPVKDFMASIRALKQDLIEFHKTLVLIIKEFKAHQNEEKADKTEDSHDEGEESEEEQE